MLSQMIFVVRAVHDCQRGACVSISLPGARKFTHAGETVVGDGVNHGLYAPHSRYQGGRKSRPPCMALPYDKSAEPSGEQPGARTEAPQSGDEPAPNYF